MKHHPKYCALRLAVLTTALGLVVVFPATAEVLTDTVSVPDFFEAGEGTLNDAVTAAINDSTLSTTVFMLKPRGRYVLTRTITVPAGERLTIVAPGPGNTQQSAPPQILWSASVETTHVSFRCYGDIVLKNIWLLYTRTDGIQTFSTLKLEDSPDSVNGQHVDCDGVLFDYAPCPYDGSGSVCVTARHFRGRFRNCYFRNNIDAHYRYYGRAVSFPFNTTGWHIDSLTFVNCTFANIGYVYMQENGEFGDVVMFNHCTFMNTMMFTLESGWWHWLAVTNSVFVNAHMIGDVLALRNPDEQPYGGTVIIDSVAAFGFPVPFVDADRHILFSHSSYVVQDWLRAYMAIQEPIWVPDTTVSEEERKPHPQPMMNTRTRAFFDAVVNGEKPFPYMNRFGLLDSTDPGFLVPATNQTGIERFLYFRWYLGGPDTNWAFEPEASVNQVWPLPENLAYSNTALLNAGMGGFPPGDLFRWFPAQYAQWKLQEESENERISWWLRTGRDTIVADVTEPGGIPAATELRQSYPNPFNPTTNIGFRISNSGLVSLKVFDLLGREVTTLVDAVLTPGTYTEVFDGSGWASGVYFYRLKAGDFVRTMRMMLIK